MAEIKSFLLSVRVYVTKCINQIIATTSFFSLFVFSFQEKPTLVSIYQVLQISTISIFVAHIIFFQTRLILYFQLLAPSLCFLLYCMYCTYSYSVQMRLKNRTRMGVIRVYRTDSMCFVIDTIGETILM
nr:unnamed protein product [Callosobruchus chinensis]